MIDAVLKSDYYVLKEFMFTLESGVKLRAKNKVEPEFMCESCYCDAEAGDEVQMDDCGHRLCVECF